jgi:hypothetical protein
MTPDGGFKRDRSGQALPPCIRAALLLQTPQVFRIWLLYRKIPGLSHRGFQIPALVICYRNYS